MTSSVASMRRELANGPVSLMAVDALLSTVVITPVVVTYWRITWKLMDLYVVPGHRAWSTAASVGIGFLGLFAFTLAQHRLKTFLRPRKHTAVYYIMSRGYTAAFAYSCVNSWRGVWDAMDMTTGTGRPALLGTVALGICALAGMRTLRNIVAPPIAILTDNYDGYFEVPTLFRVRVRVSRIRQIPAPSRFCRPSCTSVYGTVNNAQRCQRILRFGTRVRSVGVQRVDVRVGKRIKKCRYTLRHNVFVFFFFLPSTTSTFKKKLKSS